MTRLLVTVSWLTICSTFFSPTMALAEMVSLSSDDASSRPSFETPVGFGALVGDASGETDYAAIIEGQNHFKQDKDYFGYHHYGQAESRLQIGNGVGVSLSAMTGTTLYGLNRDRPSVSPHFGLEPFNGGITWDSNGHERNYYEWLPMASAGVQFTTGGCIGVPLIRGGAAAGSVTSTSWRWTPSLGTAYGAGFYMNCSRIDVGSDLTRVISQGQHVDLSVVDVSYAFSPEGLKLGIRGEHTLAPGSAVGASQEETRILLVLRSKLTR